MLLGTLGASLLVNLPTGKELCRSGERIYRTGEGLYRSGEGIRSNSLWKNSTSTISFNKFWNRRVLWKWA